MSDFLMKPKVDYAFKEIMMDEQARIGFLSAMLKLNPKEIKETQILNTNLRKQREKEKLGILDVRILMNNHTEIDIEIQLSAISVWADRALFYLRMNRNFIPVFISGRTHAISCIQIRWSFMYWNCLSCQRS